MHAGQVHAAGEPAPQRGATVRDGVDIEDPVGASTSSPPLRIWMEFRSNGPAFVVDLLLIWSFALGGFSYRSIVAGLIASSSAPTPGLYRLVPSISSLDC